MRKSRRRQPVARDDVVDPFARHQPAELQHGEGIGVPVQRAWRGVMPVEERGRPASSSNPHGTTSMRARISVVEVHQDSVQVLGALGNDAVGMAHPASPSIS
ncbi:hypothetical protein ACTMU2_19705 [Cupriavidus basilensis]